MELPKYPSLRPLPRASNGTPEQGVLPPTAPNLLWSWICGIRDSCLVLSASTKLNTSIFFLLLTGSTPRPLPYFFTLPQPLSSSLLSLLPAFSFYFPFSTLSLFFGDLSYSPSFFFFPFRSLPSLSKYLVKEDF